MDRIMNFWLVERKFALKENEWVNQYWLPGHQKLPSEIKDSREWIIDPLKAIGFARKQDALIAIDRFLTGENVMATEHVFITN